MPQLHVLNSRNFLRRLKTYTAWSLGTAAVGGLLWLVPRTINEGRIWSQKDNLEVIIELGDTEKAMKRFEDISRGGFLSSERYQKEKEDLEQKSRTKDLEEVNHRIARDEFDDALDVLEEFEKRTYWSEAHIEEERKGAIERIQARIHSKLTTTIDGYDYSLAQRSLEKFKGKPYFPDGMLAEFEPRVAEIHPDKLIAKADQSTDVEQRVNLYRWAVLESKKMGLENSDLPPKFVRAHLDRLCAEYASKDAVVVDTTFKEVADYLKSLKDGEIKTDDDKVIAFAELSRRFFESKIREDPRIASVGESSLEALDYVGGRIGMPHRERLLSELSSQYIRKICEEVVSDKADLSWKCERLNGLINFGAKYGSDVTPAFESYITLQTSVAESYGNSRALLDGFVQRQNSIPPSSRKKLLVLLADAYVRIADQAPTTSEGYLLLQAARGIYTEAGIEEHNQPLELEKKLESIFVRETKSSTSAPAAQKRRARK